jgi:hypothetical protein
MRRREFITLLGCGAGRVAARGGNSDMRAAVRRLSQKLRLV